MKNRRNNHIALITIAGIIILAVILIGGTIQLGRSAHEDTVKAVRSVSLLYLDELAGRREQVVEDNLSDHINVMDIAIGLINDEDLSSLDNMRKYQRNMKHLFNLDRFAFVDSDGLVYTADEGVMDDIADYDFDPKTISGPEISVKDPDTPDKKVVIAVPTGDRNLYIEGKKLIACFMELDMDVMLKGASIKSRNSDSTFCNIYTSNGTALSNTVLGGLAVEDNLLEALEKAEFEPGHSAAGVRDDFKNGKAGVVSFTYDGIDETLSYVPVKGTDWLLTYLIRESVISERISGISKGIISRSLFQSLLTALVLGIMFSYIIVQNRKNAKLRIEKETSEAENRARHAEMEQRLALQQKLLDQQAQQEEQEKMITALAADFRSVHGDEHLQGALIGKLTVENTGANDLTMVSSFGGGLTLASGVRATVAKYADERYPYAISVSPESLVRKTVTTMSSIM